MKCIILAGGRGSRLGPITKSLSKQIIPIYDKPMIYYPLSLCMLAGIKEILIISSPEHLFFFQNLLEDGENLGISISYKEQENPNGIAQAFILGKDFIANDSVLLLLGDNILYGHGISDILRGIKTDFNKGATVFGYRVKDPTQYGVLELDTNNNVINIVEKPQTPPSLFAVPGIYFYDNTVVSKAENLKPSPRGELEITDINNLYIKEKSLNAKLLGRGFAWFDTGNPDNMLDASNFVAAVERNQNMKIACLEEIAYHNKWIGEKEVKHAIAKYKGSSYGVYLQNLLES